MGEIADEHYDMMMDGMECPECGGNWSTCCCDRPKRLPPRPETMSMFDNLDDGENQHGKRRHPQRVPRSAARR